MDQNRLLLRLISGVGKKGPACFAIEANGKRLVLDLGEGPPPGRLPDIALAAPADALILSHGHKDHIGGLSLLPKLGNPPVYATDIVAQSLPDDIKTRPLPIRGATDVLGIPVETGRDGHAPGGVWLHFEIGDSFLYTGDYSAESALYAYDPPTRPAATALIDCSYGDYDRALSTAKDKADAWHNRGVALCKLGCPSDALASYDTALSIRPDFPEAWCNRGNTLLEMNDRAGAVLNYNKALAMRPDYAAAWTARGVALMAQQLYADALNDFERALSIEPDSCELTEDLRCIPVRQCGRALQSRQHSCGY